LKIKNQKRISFGYLWITCGDCLEFLGVSAATLHFATVRLSAIVLAALRAVASILHANEPELWITRCARDPGLGLIQTNPMLLCNIVGFFVSLKIFEQAQILVDYSLRSRF
jgi:hypothetical protein